MTCHCWNGIISGNIFIWFIINISLRYVWLASDIEHNQWIKTCKRITFFLFFFYYVISFCTLFGLYINIYFFTRSNMSWILCLKHDTWLPFTFLCSTNENSYLASMADSWIINDVGSITTMLISFEQYHLVYNEMNRNGC